MVDRFQVFLVRTEDASTVLPGSLALVATGEQRCQFSAPAAGEDKENKYRTIGGYDVRRLPTLEEVFSFLSGDKDRHGWYFHPCLALKQEHVHTADRCKPGGF